jgi:hypothetical protein
MDLGPETGPGPRAAGPGLGPGAGQPWAAMKREEDGFCVHACLCAYKNAYPHTYMHACMHACTHAHASTNICANKHMCICAYMHT